MNSLFQHYVGIDYFGAETPTSSLNGLPISSATQSDEADAVHPPPSPRKFLDPPRSRPTAGCSTCMSISAVNFEPRQIDYKLDEFTVVLDLLPPLEHLSAIEDDLKE